MKSLYYDKLIPLWLLKTWSNCCKYFLFGICALKGFRQVGISQNYMDIWEDDSMGIVIGMGPMFVQRFTQVTNHLHYLNGRNEFNGSLRKSMQILTMTEGRRKWLEVKFIGRINQVRGNDKGNSYGCYRSS